jgi:hypothetical protein
MKIRCETETEAIEIVELYKLEKFSIEFDGGDWVVSDEIGELTSEEEIREQYVVGYWIRDRYTFLKQGSGYTERVDLARRFDSENKSKSTASAMTKNSKTGKYWVSKSVSELRMEYLEDTCNQVHSLAYDLY